MERIKNVAGFRKKFFNARLKLSVFTHFIPELLRKTMTCRKFVLFLRRLLYFLSKLHSNKFVRIGNKTKIDLYVPGFPSEAFFTACRKFMTFDGKLPSTTVLISITSACHFNCEHCYQKRDLGRDVNIELLAEVVKKLQNMGIAFFNIEGGEPFLVYDRLKRLCQVIDHRSEVWVNSTGDGMTLERLTELKNLNLTAVMFSLHSPAAEEFNMFLGSDRAWDTMTEGVQLCHRAGVPVAFNMCLRKRDFYNGVFEKSMQKAMQLGASIIQIIKPKPAGGWLESGADEFSREDLERVKALSDKYNRERDYRDYPSISAQVLEEDPARFGCTAGGTDRFYINAKGDLQPCEFLNISFGNIAKDSFERIYLKMREHFRQPGETWLCERYAPQILRLVREHNVRALPLSEALSKEVYDNWDRGRSTELYDRLENKLT
jgi:MoaA/NifB/PqqE/SkfB family radical SAM enzyme